jgi:hypothetical protein
LIPSCAANAEMTVTLADESGFRESDRLSAAEALRSCPSLQLRRGQGKTKWLS